MQAVPMGGGSQTSRRKRMVGVLEERGGLGCSVLDTAARSARGGQLPQQFHTVRWGL